MTSASSVLVSPHVLDITSRRKRLRQSTVLALREYHYQCLRRLSSILFTNHHWGLHHHTSVKPKHPGDLAFSQSIASEFKPASQHEFQLAQKSWVESPETQKRLIRSSDDHVNFIAMKSVIEGCENKTYFNSFLSDPEEGNRVNDKQLHVALDSEMQRFAHFKLYTTHDGTQYLMWLGFAKRTTRIESTYVYTTHGPPLTVPPKLYESAPLLSSKFSVADVASILKL